MRQTGKEHNVKIQYVGKRGNRSVELKKHTQAAQKHWGDYVQHVKIEADTTEIDEAIRKVEKLVEVIEKANQLVDTLFKRLEA